MIDCSHNTTKKKQRSLYGKHTNNHYIIKTQKFPKREITCNNNFFITKTEKLLLQVIITKPYSTKVYLFAMAEGTPRQQL